MGKQEILEIKKGQTGRGLLIENDGYTSLDLSENKRLVESFGIGDGKRLSPKELPNPFIVSAVFQKFGIENANGRVYPETTLKNAVEKYMVNLKERKAYGEANHPDGSNISVDRIAINIIELHWENHTLVGKMEIPISEGFRNMGIVSTCADMVAQWLISGLRLGVSSRGLGSVEKHFGQLVVGDDYEIVCWDVVAQPSTPQAYIGLTDSELAPYVEGKASKENTITESKYDKFEKWLTD